MTIYNRIISIFVVVLILFLSSSSLPNPVMADPIHVVQVYQEPVTIEKHSLNQNQMNCLITAVYHEGRGDSLHDKKGIAHVILNRVESGEFESTVCKTIAQKVGHAYQFSFYPHKPKVKDVVSFNQIKDELKNIENEPDFTHGALYFHSIHCHPHWKNMIRTIKSEEHIFYKERHIEKA